MTGPRDGHAEDTQVLRKLAEVVGRAADGSAAPEVEARSRARLLAATRPARRRARWLAVALAPCALATVLVVLAPRPSPRALSYTAEGLDGAGQAWQRRERAHPGRLLFSDGSQAALDADGRARLVEIDQHGATLRIEAGELDLAVVPRPRARWRVLAGPFTVRVTGTRFRVGWEPGRGRFRLVLVTGSVAVTGPGLDGERQLRAGEALDLLEHAPRTAAATPGEPAAEAAPGEEPAGPPAAAPAREPGPAGRLPADAALGWAGQVAAGRFAEVVAQARARAGTDGLPRLLARLPASDLAALADAARYAGEARLARAALSAEVRRFARSERGALAAFLLARSFHDEAGGDDALARAITFYARYLALRPDGDLAAEALSRMMLACRASGRSTEARQHAREYLRRFPDGPAAAQARHIAGP